MYKLPQNYPTACLIVMLSIFDFYYISERSLSWMDGFPIDHFRIDFRQLSATAVGPSGIVAA